IYTVEKNITIHPAPVPVFISDVTVGCDTPLVVNFTDQTPDPGGIITERIWEFGDVFNRKFTTSSNVYQHIYKKEGYFLPILTIKTDKGCQITKVADNSSAISLQFPKIISKNLPDSGCVGLVVTPNLVFNIQDDIKKWIWEVLDEAGSTVQTATTISPTSPPSFVFNQRGIYQIKLTITAPPYCEKSYSWPVKVGVTPTPFVISADKYEDCANSAFDFFYNRTGVGPEPTGFKWKFSTGDSSLERNPSRIFKELGLHNVSLTVYDNGCPLTVTETGLIKIKGVIADFNVVNDCANPLQPRFEDKSRGNIAQWEWSFGDGSPNKNYAVAELPFLHAYTTPDKYKVKLTVTGDGCVFSDSSIITVTNETAIDFNPLAPVCLSDGSTTLKADINNPAFIKKYYWNLGCGERQADDGEFQIMFANTCGAGPYSRGDYRMWIRVVDVNGCEYKSPEKDIYIGGPEADIAALSSLSGCENLTVKFEDRSDIDPDIPIQSRIWDFGDGSQENILSGPVSHLFTTTGSFPVKLKVTDQAGCTSTSEILEVNTSKIDIDFSASQTSSCIDKQIQFEPIASSRYASYFWEFGDGLTSNSSNPRISYSSAGNKSVRLTVRDGYGCEAAMFKAPYIEIDMPDANFSAIKSTADCPPFDAQFNFEGKYAQRFEWDFGDGSKSTLPNPEHLFTRAGEYIVKLKVTSPGGCQVVSNDYKIEVSGPSGVASFDAYSCEPFDATFKVSSASAQYVIIDYGDGQVTDRMPYQSQFLYRYTDTGFFQPKIFLSNTEGCLVRLPVPHGLKTVEVQPVFKPDNNIFCARGDVRFTDLSMSNDKFIAWEWTLGDGATAVGKNISHLYDKPGVYDVKMIVKTELGCVDSAVRVGLIEVNPNPDVEITVSRPIICEDETVDFSIREVSSPNPIVDWFWDFTNGNSSTSPTPASQLFRKKGMYPVRLYVTDSRGCADTALFNYPVNPVPLLDAGADRHLCLGKPEQLRPSGAATYQWSGGLDLTCINCEN
ncbi:MAG: PKD domain-containing protein, partial [bacterium]